MNVGTEVLQNSVQRTGTSFENAAPEIDKNGQEHECAFDSQITNIFGNVPQATIKEQNELKHNIDAECKDVYDVRIKRFDNTKNEGNVPQAIIKDQNHLKHTVAAEGKDVYGVQISRFDVAENDGDADDEQTTSKAASRLSAPLFPERHVHHRKRHKRKQTRPRSICETQTSNQDDSDPGQQRKRFKSNGNESQDSDDPTLAQDESVTDGKRSVLIEQKPLCSKLCIRKERRAPKSPVRREPTITSEEITEIINATNENTTSPCTTNRYRRHFLKQLRKAEARRHQDDATPAADNDTGNEKDGRTGQSDVDGVGHVKNSKNKQSNVDGQDHEQTESDDNYSLDGQKIKIDTVSHGDEIECNVCCKRFADVGPFMAHYICHSSFEKEHAGLISLQKSRDGTTSKEPSHGGEVCTDSIQQGLPVTKIRGEKVDTKSNGKSGECSDTSRLSIDWAENQTLLQDGSQMRGPSRDGSEIRGPSRDGSEIRGPSRDGSENQARVPSRSGTEDKDKDPTNPDLIGDSTYFCQVCNQRFNNILALQSHSTSHVASHSGDEGSGSDGKHEHYCHMCSKKFASAGSLLVHNKIHTGDNPYTCLKCKKTFRDKTRLTTHIRVHTGEKPFQCSFCYKSFSQKGNLKLHQKIHTLERDYLCKVCGTTFRLKSDLVRHVKIHGIKGEPPWLNENSSGMEMSADEKQAGHSSSDEMMEKSIRDSVSWISASTAGPSAPGAPGAPGGASHGQEPGKGASGGPDAKGTDPGIGKLSLTKMMAEKMEKDLGRLLPELPGFKPEEKTLMMSIDSEVEFIKAMTLAKLRAGEETASQPVPCPLCGLVLTSVDNLNHHVLLHHNPLNTFSAPVPATDLLLFGLDPHPIANLDRPSPGLDNLDKSLTSSGSKKYYRCKECCVDFSSFPEFQLHMKTHSTFSDAMTLRDAKCSICHALVAPDDLADHLSSHTGDKTYSCPICAKVFRRSHHLQTHLRTHTGDRPYICPDCGKCFVRGDHLQNHRRTHTGEKPYSCDVCHKTYSQSHHLLRHKRTHTGERPYCCVLCAKTFSRDHHLKKHMETHNCVVFPDKSTDDTGRRSATPVSPPPPAHKAPPSSTVSMVTRSSNRIAQMMSSLATDLDHSASRLMESMVKRHLLEQEKTSAFSYLDDHCRQEPGQTEATDLTTVGKSGEENKMLKVADFLDEGISKKHLNVVDFLGEGISKKHLNDADFLGEGISKKHLNEADFLKEGISKKHLNDQNNTPAFTFFDDHHVQDLRTTKARDPQSREGHHVYDLRATKDRPLSKHGKHAHELRTTRERAVSKEEEHDGKPTKMRHPFVEEKHAGKPKKARHPFIEETHARKPTKSHDQSKAGKSVEEKRGLKIADILNDDLPLGPKMSEALVVDHVIRVTRGSLGKASKDVDKAAKDVDQQLHRVIEGTNSDSMIQRSKDPSMNTAVTDSLKMDKVTKYHRKDDKKCKDARKTDWNEGIKETKQIQKNAFDNIFENVFETRKDIDNVARGGVDIKADMEKLLKDEFKRIDEESTRKEMALKRTDSHSEWNELFSSTRMKDTVSNTCPANQKPQYTVSNTCPANQKPQYTVSNTCPANQNPCDTVSNTCPANQNPCDTVSNTCPANQNPLHPETPKFTEHGPSFTDALLATLTLDLSKIPSPAQADTKDHGTEMRTKLEHAQTPPDSVRGLGDSAGTIGDVDTGVGIRSILGLTGGSDHHQRAVPDVASETGRGARRMLTLEDIVNQSLRVEYNL